jgi:uncharacterized protein (DUF885 family)
MNLNKFKQLIKECVREVIHEEMGTNIQPLNENRSFNFTSEDVHSVGLNSKLKVKQQMDRAFKSKEPMISPNPVNKFDAFLQDSAANMTAQDRQGLRNLD